jgi:glycosyltransferase involved in cell wall biosynthesis
MSHQLDKSAIFSMCLVLNEVDIIRQCLLSASQWSDAIFVYDNGSSDGTWEIVQDMARKYPAVVPFKQDSKPFRDSLRAEIFARYRAQSTENDWWCRLDADELYIDNPREFLGRVPTSDSVVWSASFQYYFTDREVARYRSDPTAFDDSVPVERKCRHYKNDWSEPRFFRYRATLKYENSDWPSPLGRSHAQRIRLKHFQYRSPSQIEKRLATRRGPMAAGLFCHEQVPDWSLRISTGQSILRGTSASYFPFKWEERVVSSTIMLSDDESGYYQIDERALPPIRDLS